MIEDYYDPVRIFFFTQWILFFLEAFLFVGYELVGNFVKVANIVLQL